MKENEYLKDISEIKSIMNKSTRFISLSGTSGILAGIYALIGAFSARLLINSYQSGNASGYVALLPISYFEWLLIGIASIVLVASVLTGYYLTSKKAKKNKETMWNATSKQLLKSFLVPLVTGGFFCIILYQYGIIGLIAPSTLIFYGLACINASKHTLGDIYYLGLANVITGLIATQFIGYGILFWAVGFGIFHIIYGALMRNKYEK